jgi:hypothetical protein
MHYSNPSDCHLANKTLFSFSFHVFLFFSRHSTTTCFLFVKELVKELALLTVQTLTGMTTDVYPRENCIAPAIALILWTTNTKNRCAREG